MMAGLGTNEYGVNFMQTPGVTHTMLNPGFFADSYGSIQNYRICENG